MWLIISCLSMCVGCGSSNARCNSFLVLPAVISVANAVSNAAICDAELTATGPNGQLTLSTNPDDDSACEYNGPGVTGSYTVIVSKSGFQTATVPNVSATIQSCDGPKESPQKILVKLTPN
ncbi:MAG TPA: carboxypeptidase-like regulatory domain-containing protein [Polyangiaceae bacterium]|nr:carboxypeptidase-like regulatory domain-containing protein [Polyangiaceae bacterium]